MKEKRGSNFIYKAIPILALIIIVVFALISYMKNFSGGTSNLEQELNMAYDVSAIAINPATEEDRLSLITKINSNSENTIINNLINPELQADFKFTADLELTQNEFCHLLNIIINSKMQDINFVNFIQCDIAVNSNSNIQRSNITTYANIEKDFFKILNINLNNKVLIVNEYIKNYNNITNQELSKTYSVNGITQDEAGDEIRNTFFKNMFADVYDDVVANIQQTFNCNIVYSNNGVTLYA